MVSYLVSNSAMGLHGCCRPLLGFGLDAAVSVSLMKGCGAACVLGRLLSLITTPFTITDIMSL